MPPLHGVPSDTTGSEQSPVAGAQVPGRWHSAVAAQITGSDPAQTPAWHLSVRVQPSPSAQVVPSAAGGFEQTPVAGSQVPTTWH
jgi:hypothetical protein